MFIVTAQMVKPINRDDIPQMRGLDGLHSSSPLGVEPKGEGINGKSGFSTGTSENNPAAAPTPVKTKPATPKPAETKAVSMVSPNALELMPPPPQMPAVKAKSETTAP